MKSVWKIWAAVVCVGVIAGATVLAWSEHTWRVAAAKLAEEVRVTRAKAEQGDAASQVKLGRAYHYGFGVPKDLGACLYWYQKAAGQGYARGEDGIGYLYYFGDGVAQNYAEALRWYTKAASQGDAWAEGRLGSMYFYKHGVPQDIGAAAGWYRKAADQGDTYGEEQLGSMLYRGVGVPQDNAEAARWFRRAADQGDTQAEYDLSYMYRYGLGVPENYAEAVRWARKAAAQGNQDAQIALSMKLTNATKIFLCLELAAGLFFASSPLRSGVGFRKRGEKLVCGVGILILVSVGYVSYGYAHHLLRHWNSVNAFTVVHHLINFAIIALLIPILRLGSDRRSLLSVILGDK